MAFGLIRKRENKFFSQNLPCYPKIDPPPRFLRGPYPKVPIPSTPL